jgi:hypothetical protein
VIQIRAASKTDIEWINHRYKEVDFVPSIFEKEVIAVAEFKGERAGLGRLVTLDEQNAELGGMYVFEPYRGKGDRQRDRAISAQSRPSFPNHLLHSV